MIQDRLVSRPTDFKCIPNEHTYMYRYYTDINAVYTFAFIACAVPLEGNGLCLLEVKDSENHIPTFMDMQHAKLHEQVCSTHVHLRQKKHSPLSLHQGAFWVSRSTLRPAIWTLKSAVPLQCHWVRLSNPHQRDLAPHDVLSGVTPSWLWCIARLAIYKFHIVKL